MRKGEKISKLLSGKLSISKYSTTNFRVVDKPTTEIVGTVKRFDERKTGFSRAFRGEYGPKIGNFENKNSSSIDMSILSYFFKSGAKFGMKPMEKKDSKLSKDHPSSPGQSKSPMSSMMGGKGGKPKAIHSDIDVVSRHRKSVMLREVMVQNADRVMANVLKNIGNNYPKEKVYLKGFFRETISKGRRDVALSEAVITVRKKSYESTSDDNIWLLKGRKSVGTDKRDTLLFKLQGGPISALYLDLAKYRYNLLDTDVLERYQFSFDGVDKVNGVTNYVIGFFQKDGGDETDLIGKLYVDVDSYAISKADFSINLENRSKAASLFIKKKPRGAKAYPTKADCSVSYKEIDGVWHYNHSRSDITFKIDWDKRLFHTHYHATTEMAITDIYSSDDSSILDLENSDRLKNNIILNETIDGFGDSDFWGSDNTIEPEKSINNAIKKISRKLKKDN